MQRPLCKSSDGNYAVQGQEEQLLGVVTKRVIPVSASAVSGHDNAGVGRKRDVERTMAELRDLLRSGLVHTVMSLVAGVVNSHFLWRATCCPSIRTQF